MHPKQVYKTVQLSGSMVNDFRSMFGADLLLYNYE